MSGILKGTASIVRYKVNGEIENNIIQFVTDKLKENVILDIDEGAQEKSVGWTSTNAPHAPFFEDSSFLIGQYFVFSLRIDKKKIPAKVLKKHVTIESDRRLKFAGKEFISKSERQQIRESVSEMLLLKMHSTPNEYDLMWDYEEKELMFFTTNKSANEELESIFNKSFGFTLIKLFPYTNADLTMDLNVDQRAKLTQLTPQNFQE